MKKIFVILLLFICIKSYAQEDNYDAFLARQFLQNGEYAKAAEYFGDLIKTNPDEYYQEYLNLLIQLKEFDKAEKMVMTLYKQSDKNPMYLLDLGNLYSMQNKNDDAEKQFSRSKSLSASHTISEMELGNR